MTFHEGGMIFEYWRDPVGIDITVKAFAFNITNADAFLEGTAEKLKLQEVGPFVYR